ncbi:D-aminopeptidase [Pseudomonas pseudonitroreducens]|uniref:D-aminopeptidase n=1 Tax=Pseudomonas pseudonitroreducens TaxID=2892326 RepID=UPI001F1F7525|nr:D-aminopeptidase [Pseudomonas pseudonitroreducens]
MQDIQQILDSLPVSYRGPGGAIAVLKDGRLAGQQVWGFADLEKRIAMTDQTPVPICSITKQMVCAVLKDLERHPTALMANGASLAQADSTALKYLLPAEIGPRSEVTLQHLCDNQSGIRDYWAMTLLWGGHPEGRFSLDEDAPQALQYLQSLHFEPGSQYAYANTNFHILARAIEQVSGRSISELLTERLFEPAGMSTARFCEKTEQHPGPCVGYEGSAEQGYIPARNQVEWSGDAGVVASMQDMIAYESWLQRQWNDPASIYRALAEQPHFADGAPAHYGNGLAHVEIAGFKALGHGGALRGFRLQRLHVPSEKLSVIVMLNHEADPAAAAEFVLRSALDLRELVASSVEADPAWFGDYLDPVSQLAIRVAPVGTGEISLTYAGYPETLHLVVSGRARSREMEAAISGDDLWLRRIEDNREIRAIRLHTSNAPTPNASLQGNFHCAELGSTFHAFGLGNHCYAAFDGFLGKGPAMQLQQLTPEVWLLKCPRGMDAPAPGDWTLVVDRDAAGRTTGFTLGCWLARGLKYQRIDEGH